MSPEAPNFFLLLLIFLTIFICDLTLDDPLTYLCSSFNDKPGNSTVNGILGNELFEREQDDLLTDLKDIPKKACDRKVSFSFD